MNSERSTACRRFSDAAGSTVGDSRNVTKKRPKTGGRTRGTPNKVTATAREAFTLAFQGIGGTPTLEIWAKANPTEFFKLYARLIPQEHVGEGGSGPIATVVKHIYESTESPAK